MSGSKIVVIDTGKNNDVSIASSVVADPSRPFSIVIRGNNNKIVIHEGVKLGHSVVQIVGSDCTLEIGAYCHFINNCNLILDQQSSIIIGQRTNWAHGVLRAEHNSTIRVGELCMLSADIHVRTSDGHGIFDIATKQMINPASDVTIGDHVWLGIGASVNKGTVIGTGSIVGMSSVATGKLDPYCIYAGCPARKVKEGITWSPGLSFDLIPEDYQFGIPK